MRIEVIGSPGPQGSKSFKGMDGRGHAILIESSKKVRPWRQAVTWEAREALPYENFCFHGPVAVMMTFTLPKPKSAPKSRRTFPDKKPDVSKLVRSTEDALTDAGIWEDDARVVCCLSHKVFPGEGADSLPVPGVVIRIENYTGTIPPDWIERTE